MINFASNFYRILVKCIDPVLGFDKKREKTYHEDRIHASIPRHKVIVNNVYVWIREYPKAWFTSVIATHDSVTIHWNTIRCSSNTRQRSRFETTDNISSDRNRIVTVSFLRRRCKSAFKWPCKPPRMRLASRTFQYVSMNLDYVP